MGDSWKLFEGDNNPLYDVYVVSATDPSYTKQVAEEAADLKNVSRSDYGGALRSDFPNRWCSSDMGISCSGIAAVRSDVSHFEHDSDHDFV